MLMRMLYVGHYTPPYHSKNQEHFCYGKAFGNPPITTLINSTLRIKVWFQFVCYPPPENPESSRRGNEEDPVGDSTQLIIPKSNPLFLKAKDVVK